MTMLETITKEKVKLEQEVEQLREEVKELRKAYESAQDERAAAELELVLVKQEAKRWESNYRVLRSR